MFGAGWASSTLWDILTGSENVLEILICETSWLLSKICDELTPPSSKNAAETPTTAQTAAIIPTYFKFIEHQILLYVLRQMVQT